MRKRMIYKLGLFGMMTAIMLGGCKKDDSQEQIAQEMRLLEQYLADNNITQEPTASGLYYIPIVEGTGMSPTHGTWIEIEYTGMQIDGTIFATSDESTADLHNIYFEEFLYGPFRVQLGNIPLKGLNEGIKLMKVGEIAKFILPSSLAMGGTASGNLPAYSTLIYNIELLEAFDDPVKHEQEKIWEYLKESEFENVDSTASGLYYIQEKAGTGLLFHDGDHVLITYTGQFLDGREFDSNVGEEALNFTFPGEYFIEGWTEGLKLMRDEEEGMLIIPYQLGYGQDGLINNSGTVAIPPYMTLVFYMKTNKAS
ncbi:MAG: FKBP-type peptidyl-prolyl cis-trans isomerase [Bacteroidales bacterium]